AYTVILLPPCYHRNASQRVGSTEMSRRSSAAANSRPQASSSRLLSHHSRMSTWTSSVKYSRSFALIHGLLLERGAINRYRSRCPVPFPVQWFSRPPPSTTRPSLRGSSLANLALFAGRLLACVSWEQLHRDTGHTIDSQNFGSVALLSSRQCVPTISCEA